MKQFQNKTFHHCLIVTDPFRGTSVGAAMFDHVATHPLLASVVAAFTMQVRDAGAVQQTSVSTNIIGGDCARRKALATAVEDMQVLSEPIVQMVRAAYTVLVLSTGL